MRYLTLGMHVPKGYSSCVYGFAVIILILQQSRSRSFWQFQFGNLYYDNISIKLISYTTVDCNRVNMVFISKCNKLNMIGTEKFKLVIMKFPGTTGIISLIMAFLLYVYTLL